MKRVLIAVVALALLAGCGVSKQIVAEKDAALDACRKDLAGCQTEREASGAAALRLNAELDAAGARAAKVEADLTACQLGRSNAEADLRQASQDLAACRETAEAAKREAAALKQREEELRSRLGKEIDEKTVEIENLRGRLSVRVVDRILFDSGSAEILPGGKRVLDKVASVLKDATEMVRVEGHTDDVPIGPSLKDKYFSNWELSAARASSVVRYFQYGHQMEPTRLEAVGLAMYRPVAPNDSPENRHRNRRVEIVLTPVPR
ncbi:MAG: OmpA family protein [Proteobacteria bacterium]|nr:OmpA family protein [Pseudomonadota bacterium]